VRLPGDRQGAQPEARHQHSAATVGADQALKAAAHLHRAAGGGPEGEFVPDGLVRPASLEDALQVRAFVGRGKVKQGPAGKVRGTVAEGRGPGRLNRAEPAARLARGHQVRGLGKVPALGRVAHGCGCPLIGAGGGRTLDFRWREGARSIAGGRKNGCRTVQGCGTTPGVACSAAGQETRCALTLEQLTAGCSGNSRGRPACWRPRHGTPRHRRSAAGTTARRAACYKQP